MPFQPHDKSHEIRKNIESTRFRCSKNNFRLTITCGVSTYNAEQGVSENIDRVDKALYTGKREGKNRTVIS